MATQPVLNRLPPLVQNERNRDEIDILFDADTDVYTLPKAPVLDVHAVTGFVNGTQTTFVEGDDYELLTDSEDRIDEINWDIGGNTPDDVTHFTVDQTFKTLINRYTLAHDAEFDEIDASVDDAITSHEIENASGDDLDRIGAIFGQLGRRRGRGDQEYRTYLSSVVQSFNGRGSIQGLEFAIASAIGADRSNIDIIEQFDELEYEIQVSDVDTAFISSAINDLAELADPSVVQLSEAVIVFDAGGVDIGGDSSTVAVDETGLGGGTLTLDGNSTLG